MTAVKGDGFAASLAVWRVLRKSDAVFRVVWRSNRSLRNEGESEVDMGYHNFC